MLNHGRWFFALAGLTFGLLWPLVSRAEEWTPPSIIISEVNWAGSSKSLADEWLELTNLSRDAIVVGGWTLEGASENPITLPDDAVIGPSGTFLIANYDEMNEKSALAVHPNVVTTSVSLSNSTLKIILKNADGAVVDMAGNGEKPPAGTTANTGSGTVHASMVRRAPLLGGETPDAWATSEMSVGFDERATEKGTPGTNDVILSDGTTAPSEGSSSVTGDSSSPPTSDEVVAGPQNDIETTTEPTPEPPMEEPALLVSTETPVNSVTFAEETHVPEPVTILPTYPVGTLVINEVLPNPMEGEEWVEIFNPYNNVIPLGGWKVRDASGRAVPLPNQLLGWQQFVVVRKASGWLNNDAEAVELMDPTGNVIDRVEYTKETKPQKGAAVMRNDALALTITTTPTPSAPNVLTAVPEPEPKESPPPPPEPRPSVVALAAPLREEPLALTETPTPAPSTMVAAAGTTAAPKTSSTAKSTTKKAAGPRRVAVREIRDLRSGAKVVTEGVVTAGTDTFGSQIVYIQSDNVGIQLFRVNGRLSGLKIDDRVQAEGILGTSEGEQRIKIQNASGIHVLGSGEAVAGEVKLKDLNEQHVGSLVKVAGSVAYISGKKIMLENEDGEVWIAPTERVRIPSEIVVPGTALEITGIITTQNGELRLVPRSADEVRMLTPPPQAVISEPTGKERAQGQKETAAWTLTAAGLTTLIGLAIKHFFLKSI